MNKEKRIRKNEEFQAIIAKKHSSANRCFIIYYDLKKQDNARVGISVSKKLGKAVQRNKIKRQLRMMISETIDFNTFNYTFNRADCRLPPRRSAPAAPLNRYHISTDYRFIKLRNTRQQVLFSDAVSVNCTGKSKFRTQ